MGACCANKYPEVNNGLDYLFFYLHFLHAGKVSHKGYNLE